MRQTVSLRRRLANLFASAKVRPAEKKCRWANLFPRSFPLSDRRASSIVSGLVGLFQELRGEKKGRLATATVASAFASPKIEPLEQRQLLATWTVDPTDGSGALSTITEALNIADPGDVIEVAAGDYSAENIDTDQIDITVRLLGDVTIGSLKGDAGTVDLGTHTLTTGGSNRWGRFDGVFVGSGDLVKTGTGKFTLGGDSDQYTGTITVAQGKISAIKAGSLGTADGSTVVENGAALILGETGGFTISENIAAAGTGGGSGALQASNDTVLAGNLTVTGLTRINVYGNQEYFTIAGDINGSGGIYLWSENPRNTLVLEGDNNYDGATVVRRGNLVLQGANAVPDTSDVTLWPFMQMNLTNSDETIGSLWGSGGTVELNSFTLTAGGDGTDASFSGSIVGSGGIVKEGTGSWTLDSTNLFEGSVDVNGGELVIDGTLEPGFPDLDPVTDPNNNNVVRVNDGKLSGSGGLGGRAVVLGPGGAISTEGGLQVGGVTFDDLTQFVVNIRGLTDYDKLTAGGDVDIQEADLQINVVDPYVPIAGSSFTIIELPDPNDDAIPPFEDYWEGASFIRDGVIFHISYVGGDGNDVVITVNTAPNLADTNPTLDGIDEDNRDNAGNTVAQIVDSDVLGAIVDVNGDDGGIAVTGVTTEGVGWWEYRTTGGDWTKLELPAGEALLLDLDDELRYVPDGRVGGTPEITYRAWDGTDGSSGDMVAIAATGGASAFSVFEETATIDVTELDNDPEINGAVADQDVDDNATIAPFAGVTIDKAADDTEVTVTVSLLDDTGAPTDAHGTLGGNFAPVGPGTYEFVGRKDDAEAALQTAVFDPAENIAVVGETPGGRAAGDQRGHDRQFPIDQRRPGDLRHGGRPGDQRQHYDHAVCRRGDRRRRPRRRFGLDRQLPGRQRHAGSPGLREDRSRWGRNRHLHLGDGIATYTYTGAAKDDASVQQALREAVFDPQENQLEGRLVYFEFDPAEFFNYRARPAGDPDDWFSTDPAVVAAEGGMFKLHEEWGNFMWRSWTTAEDMAWHDDQGQWLATPQFQVVDAWAGSLSGDPNGDNDEGIASFTLVIASSQTSAATADALTLWGQTLTATDADGASAPEGWQVAFYQGESEEDYTWNFRWSTDDPDKFIRPGEPAGTFSFSLTTDAAIQYGAPSIFRFGDANATVIVSGQPEYYAAVVFDDLMPDGVTVWTPGGFTDIFPTDENDPVKSGFEATEAMEAQRVFTTRFDLNVTDFSGASAEDNFTTVTAEPINDAPTARDDVDDPVDPANPGPLTTDENTAIDVGADTLLANDDDVDNTFVQPGEDPIDVLRIVDVQPIAEGGDDDTKGTLTVTIDNGVVTSINYDPGDAFQGLAGDDPNTPEVDPETATDKFVYTLSDGNGATDTATVTISVTGINEVPVANDDAITTTEDGAVDIPVTLNDTDIDGDVLLPANRGTSFNTAKGALVTINDDGTITYDPLGDPAADPAAPGPFDAMQAYDENDPTTFTTDEFTYTVTDGHGGTSGEATVTIEIRGVNDAPYAGPDADVTDEGRAIHGGPIGDADGWSAKAAYNIKTGELMVSVNSDAPGDVPDPPVAGIVEWSIRSTDGSAIFEDADGNPYPAPNLPGGVGNVAVVTGSEVKEAIPDNVLPTLIFSGLGDWIEAEGRYANEPDWIDYANWSLGEGVVDTGLALDQLELAFTIAVVIPNPAPVPGAPLVFLNLQPVAVPLTYMNTGLLPNDADVDGALAGDEISVVPETVTSAGGAAVTIFADGAYDYDPTASSRLNRLAAGEEFNDTFVYQVQDEDGAVNQNATVTITVTGLNDPPTANDDTGYETDEDAALNIPVIANDTDPDDEDDFPAGQKPTDVDEVLRVTAITVDAQDGTLEIAADGQSVTYTPDDDFFGSDSFTYEMSDGNGATDTAEVTITVNPVNDPPTINTGDNPDTGLPFNTYQIDEDAVTVLSLIADNISDNDSPGPSGALLPATADPMNALVLHTINGVEIDGTVPPTAVFTTAQGGTVEVIIPDQTTVRYTPPPEFAGTDTFTYTVRDRLDPTDPDMVVTPEATVTIIVDTVNDPPVLTSKYFFFVDDGQVQEDGAGIQLNVFDGGKAPASWDPNPASGNPVDQPPTFDPLDANSQLIGPDTDVDSASFSLVFPPDGDLSTRSGGVAFPSDLNAGEILYSPGPDFFGLDTFKYYVSDDPSGVPTAEAWVTVYVAPLPDPPDAVNDTGIEVNEETPTLIDVLANDVDPDNVHLDPQPALNEGVVITEVTQGDHGVVEFGNMVDGEFVPSVPTVDDKGTPEPDDDEIIPAPPGTVVRYTGNEDYNGTDSFTYTVDNGKGLGTDTATVNLNVLAVNDLVELVNMPVTNPETGDKDTDFTPFEGVSVQDADLGHRANVTVTITEPANGRFEKDPDHPPLIKGGFSEELDENGDPTGRYFLNNKSPAAITEALQALVFLPTENQVKPGATQTTVIQVKIEEIPRQGVLYLPDEPPYNPPIREGELAVNIYSINDRPDIDVGAGAVVINDDQTVNPFAAVNAGAGVSITEVDVNVKEPTPGAPTQSLEAWVTYPADLRGTLTDPNDADLTDDVGDWRQADVNGVIELEYIGDLPDADSIVAALKRLQFDPDQNIDPVGSSTVSLFTIKIDDGFVDPQFPVTQVVTVESVSVNSVPVANDDPDAATDEDTPLVADASRNLLDNDTDSDPDPLTGIPPEPLQVLSNTDPDSGAILTVFPDGTYEYDPGEALKYLAAERDGGAVPAETFDDTFEYTVTDGHGGQSTATVTIRVTGKNDAPAAVDDTIPGPLVQNTSHDIGFDTLIDSNDSDPDTSDIPLLTIDSVSATSQFGATVTIEGDTVKYDPTNADALKALPEGAQQEDTFTYTLIDPSGATDEATVTVTVEGVNDAPQILGTESGQTVDDKDTINPFAEVTIDDADGGPLTVTVTFPAANGDLTGAVDGTYTTTGTAAEVTAAIRALTFTPTENRMLPGESETTTFTIRVTDDKGVETTNDQTSVDSLSINDAPTLVVAGAFPIPTRDDTPVAGADLFAGVAIDDVDAGDTLGSEQTLNVAVSFPDADGTLEHPTVTLTKSVDGGVATYSFDTTASAAEADLLGLVFTPTKDLNAVDVVQDTTLTISVKDVPDQAEVTDSSTVVATTSINDAPTANDITYVIGENSVLNSSTSDPGLGPAPAGTAIAGYNSATGELIVSANGVEAWTIASLGPDLLPNPADVLNTLPTPNTTLPVTHDAKTVGEDAGVGGDLTYSGLSLGAIAASGLDIADLYIEYRAGGVTSPQMPLVVLEGEPSGGSGVVRNDLDPDPGDTPLTVLAADTRSALLDAAEGDNVAVAADGTLTYDPTGMAALEKLAKGEMATDTFSYTITDGHGQQQTATVTVFIRGENDAPNAVDDTVADPLLQTSTLDLTFEDLITRGDYPDDTSTDWDPDHADNALLTIDSVSPLSDKGATVTIDGETITYDPTDAADLKALPKDVQDIDTFTYNLVDPNGGSDTGTVTITVTGVNDAPTISGVPADLGQVNDNVQDYKPFAGVSIGDADDGDKVTLTITLDDPEAGTLVGNGFTETAPGSGIYTTGPVDAADAHGWVQSLVYEPTQFKESPAGGSTSVTFTFAATDQLGDPLVVVDDQGNWMPGVDPEITLTAVWNGEPQVEAVYVRGTEWFTDADNNVHSEYMDLLDTYGYKIPTTELDEDGNVVFGTEENQLRNLPWFNVNQIVVQFSEEVEVAADDLQLFGVNVAEYELAPGGFQYYKDYEYTTSDGTDVVIPDANVAVWTLAKNLGEGDVANNDAEDPVTLTDDTRPDKLLLVLDADSIVRAGTDVKLDGDWTNPEFPVAGSAGTSGDGTAGGDFAFRMNVLPGDIDQSLDSENIVDPGDVGKVAQNQFAMMDSDYNVFYNVDGKVEGIALKFHVTGTDTVLVRNAQGTELPDDEPAPAPLPALSPASAALPDGFGGMMTNLGRTVREHFSQLDVGLVSDLEIGGADWRAALRRSTVRAVDVALDELGTTSNVGQAASDLVRDCWSRYTQHRNDRMGALDDLFSQDDSVVDNELFGGEDSPLGKFFRSMAARGNQRANGFMRRMTF